MNIVTQSYDCFMILDKLILAREDRSES